LVLLAVASAVVPCRGQAIPGTGATDVKDVAIQVEQQVGPMHATRAGSACTRSTAASAQQQLTLVAHDDTVQVTYIYSNGSCRGTWHDNSVGIDSNDNTKKTRNGSEASLNVKVSERGYLLFKSIAAHPADRWVCVVQSCIACHSPCAGPHVLC
jgi:outer membrane murein-binding lipoprotein Lpp